MKAKPKAQNKKRGARKPQHKSYDYISYGKRIRLIYHILISKWTCSLACKQFNIKLTTGCLIFRTFRQTGKIMQKGKEIMSEDEKNMLVQLNSLTEEQRKQKIAQKRKKALQEEDAEVKTEEKDDKDEQEQEVKIETVAVKEEPRQEEEHVVVKEEQKDQGRRTQLYPSAPSFPMVSWYYCYPFFTCYPCYQ